MVEPAAQVTPDEAQILCGEEIAGSQIDLGVEHRKENAVQSPIARAVVNHEPGRNAERLHAKGGAEDELEGLRIDFDLGRLVASLPRGLSEREADRRR